MNREGFTGFSRGEARTRTATSLNFDNQGPLNKLMRLPWGFILLIAAMALTGIAMLYSSAHTNPAEAHLWKLQLVRFVVCFFMMIGLAMLPLSWWMRLAFPAYVGTIVLLILVEVMGVTGGGAQRWLQIGPVAVQPSEFAKLAVTMALARYYQMVLQPQTGRVMVHLGALAIILLPAALIFKQPDFGTTLALVASGGVVIFLPVSSRDWDCHHRRCRLGLAGLSVRAGTLSTRARRHVPRTIVWRRDQCTGRKLSNRTRQDRHRRWRPERTWLPAGHPVSTRLCA